MYFNFMAAVTIHSDFGVQENKGPYDSLLKRRPSSAGL